MMYNWPPNTGAQQTLSGWCNSTLPFTYRPSRSSLFLLYGDGCCPTDSSAFFPSIFFFFFFVHFFPIKLVLKYSRKKGSAALPCLVSSRIYLIVFSPLEIVLHICTLDFFFPSNRQKISGIHLESRPRTRVSCVAWKEANIRDNG